MENVAGDFKNSDCYKFSFFNDEGLKLGHFDISDMLFPFLAFVDLMKNS